MFGWKWDAKMKAATATTAVIAAVGAFYPLRPVVFVGNSMAPTYASYSVAMSTRDVGTLQRGDVVVVDSPAGRIVKRVALLPGDGYWEKYRYGKWMSTLEVAKNAHKGKERFTTVPPGTVYLVGDNRSTSIDSRTFGPVPVENVRLKLTEPRASRSPLALYGAVLRKNFVLRTEKPVVE